MRIDLDALFASAPSPFVLLDCDLRMVWANEAYATVTGRVRDQLIGRRLTDAFPAPADSIPDQMLHASFRRVFASGRIDHLPLIPYPIAGPDGEVEDRYWSATHTPICDAHGKVEYILQNTTDVTDLYRDNASDAPRHAEMIQRAEAVSRENLELGELTEFLRSVFDQAPSFIAITIGPEHRFQLVNGAYVEIVGRSDLVGKSLREIMPELEGQGFLELLDQVLATGEAVSRKGVPVTLNRHASGGVEQRFIDFVYHPLKDAHGRAIGVFVQGNDVTAQKVAEAQVLESQGRFRTMAQAMPNHVWTAGPDGGLDWLNDQTYVYTGAAEGSLYGTDWGQVVHPDDLAGVVQTWSAAVTQGAQYEAEFRIRAADGSFRWHLVRARPVRSVGDSVRLWVGTNTDIEDRKAIEAAIADLNASLEERVAQRNRELETLNDTLRQSQKMEAIGNLAGGIAHDFNNLLQTITGSVQLAMRDLPPGSPAKARLDQAMKGVTRGATLASQLLSFGRRQPLAPKVINLGRLLREADNIVRSAIGEGVEVETVVTGGLWNTFVDPTNVESAVLNLAINARDAMGGRGKLTIELGNAYLDDGYARTHAEVVSGQYVMLAVTDTGSGMPPEVVERVFDPFFTTKPEGKGTGLGLSMVYGFVKQSGGHVKIYSEVGSGTSIKIYLPRSMAEEVVTRPVPAGELAGGTETILLVEDDEDVRATAAGLLQDLGYTVMQARDAERGMVIVESGARIDLLFTDVVMPGRLTSRELAEKARMVLPGLAVLFTSGYTQNSIVHGGRLDAGLHLLSKPYTQEALAQKVREVLVRDGHTSLIPPAAPPARTESNAVLTAVVGTETRASAYPDIAGLRVLVCEDDVIIRLSLAEGLRDVGCSVFEAGTAGRALELLSSETVDVLITDVGLPDLSGVVLAERAIEIVPALPVIFATGDGRVDGADERRNCVVLTKPFSDQELIAALRRVAASDL